MDIDEQEITNLLKKKGLRAERFTKEVQFQSKTPYFRVFKGNKLVFFCEVKTVSRDQWLDRLVKKAPPSPLTIVGGTRNDPVFNRLSNKIHEAVQQFDAVNSDVEYPNVLIFVNHDRKCGYPDLIAVTTGHFLGEGGSYPNYLQFSEGRIKEEKGRIHLYIWIDEFKGNQYLFNDSEKRHYDDLCSYFGIDPESPNNIP